MNASKAVITMVLVALALPAETSFAQKILSSFELHAFGGGAFGCPSDRVQFFLEHNSQAFTHIVTLGHDLRFWEDGETGEFDFTPANSPMFSEFADLVTDGQDDFLVSLGYAEGCGGGGPSFQESQMLSGDPDLAGIHLDFIRLIVRDIAVNQYDPPCDCGPGTRFDADITWQFWGTPIPEPAVTSLILIALMAALRRIRLRQAVLYDDSESRVSPQTLFRGLV